MKVIIAGGGTAGHINPALAIAHEIRKKYKKSEILYIGSKKGMESKIVPKEGYNYKGIDIMGFVHRLKISNLKYNSRALVALFKGNNQVKKIIKEFKPDLVIGTGGYVSGPVLFQAVKYGAKTAIHEQNAFPGMTTKALAKKVDIVFSAFSEAKQRLKIKGDFFVVGNPVRENFILNDKKKAREKLNIDLDAPMILSSGGSLGAREINRAIAKLIKWHYEKNEIFHYHSAGKKIDEFNEMLKHENVDLKNNDKINISTYIDNMGDCFAAADLIIGRAGAISLAEIQCAGKASILIPSPNVTENHQYFNAKVLEKNQAAILIEEKDLSGEILIKTVEDLLFNKKTLQKFEKNSQNMAIFNSSEQIIEKIELLMKKL